MAEPVFHYFDNCLPDNHPLLVNQSLHCFECQDLVHCNNEVMTAWFETGVGVMCLECFAKRWRTIGEYTIWPRDELVMPDGV